MRNKVFAVLSHKVVGLLVRQHRLTDTPRRGAGRGSSYFVSAGSMRPQSWLPGVGEEPPRSHVLHESGRSTLDWSPPASPPAEPHGTAATGEVGPVQEGGTLYCVGATSNCRVGQLE